MAIEKPQIEFTGCGRLEKAGVASRHCLASFLLLPPQLGDIKLDLKGASRWASGLVIVDSPNREYFIKMLVRAERWYRLRFQPDWILEEERSRGLRERGRQVIEQSCFWAALVGQLRKELWLLIANSTELVQSASSVALDPEGFLSFLKSCPYEREKRVEISYGEQAVLQWGGGGGGWTPKVLAGWDALWRSFPW